VKCYTTDQKKNHTDLVDSGCERAFHLPQLSASRFYNSRAALARVSFPRVPQRRLHFFCIFAIININIGASGVHKSN
jgi:hypothetical protein